MTGPITVMRPAGEDETDVDNSGVVELEAVSVLEVVLEASAAVLDAAAALVVEVELSEEPMDDEAEATSATKMLD